MSEGRLEGERKNFCWTTKRRCRSDAAFVLSSLSVKGQEIRVPASGLRRFSDRPSSRRIQRRSLAILEIGALDSSSIGVKRERVYSRRIALLTWVALTLIATTMTATRCWRRDWHAARRMFRMRNANCRAPPEDESFIRGRRASIGQALALARSPGPPSPPPPPHPPHPSLPLLPPATLLHLLHHRPHPPSRDASATARNDHDRDRGQRTGLTATPGTMLTDGRPFRK